MSQKEGPLTARQRDALNSVIAGQTHEEIATRYGVVKTAITNDIRFAADVLGAHNTAEAVAKWTTAQTLAACGVRLLQEPLLAELGRVLIEESEGTPS